MTLVARKKERLKPILGGMEAWKQPCWSWEWVLFHEPLTQMSLNFEKILNSYARQFKTWRMLPFIKKNKTMSEIIPKIMTEKP